MAKSDAFNVNHLEQQNTINMIQKYASDASDRLYIHQFNNLWQHWTHTLLPAQAEVSVCDPQWTEQFRLPTVRVTCKQITSPGGDSERQSPASDYKLEIQNCILATAIQKNLISVSHVCRDMNAFVTDDGRCACFEKGTNKTMHECNMAIRMYYIYNTGVGSEVEVSHILYLWLGVDW